MKRIIFFLPVLFLYGCLNGVAQDVLDNVNSTFSGVETIQVKGVFCDVGVRPGNSAIVEVIGEIRGVRRTDDFKIRTQQSGALLKVWVEHPRSMRGNVKGFLDLIVPSDVSLRVDNLSGNVSVNSIGSDEVILESVSGDVKASEIPCDLIVKSVSGDVSAQVIGGKLEAASVSGDLKVDGVKGAFNGHSTSGDAIVKMVEGAVSVNTISGDCCLKNILNSAVVKSTSGDLLMSEINGDLKGKAISGDIFLEKSVGAFELETLSGNQHGEEVMLTGNSRFHSNSGDIKMVFLNAEEELSYRLSSGSGSLRVGGHSEKKEMTQGIGSIVVTGVTASGNQRYQ